MTETDSWKAELSKVGWDSWVIYGDEFEQHLEKQMLSNVELFENRRINMGNMSFSNVGFLGFGEVGSTFSKYLYERGASQIIAYDVMANDKTIGAAIRDR
ncbi:MAG: hypothetical protein MUO21_09285, partial [Nitrososphaeraceae archaeon]|nr:hypothetical protein [Nitrososphaeraceae archaeon]